jgi:hypothetical protein
MPIGAVDNVWNRNAEEMRRKLLVAVEIRSAECWFPVPNLLTAGQPFALFELYYVSIRMQRVLRSLAGRGFDMYSSCWDCWLYDVWRMSSVRFKPRPDLGLINSSLWVASAVCWRYLGRMPPLKRGFFFSFVYKNLPYSYHWKVLRLWNPSKCLYIKTKYRGADKSLVRPTSRCILFDGENISFDAILAIYINSTNIPPIMIINRTYENQNLLSL